MFVKKTYPSWNPSDKCKRICARLFQRNNFVNYQQYNAGFAKKYVLEKVPYLRTIQKCQVG